MLETLVGVNQSAASMSRIGWLFQIHSRRQGGESHHDGAPTAWWPPDEGGFAGGRDLIRHRRWKHDKEGQVSESLGHKAKVTQLGGVGAKGVTS